MVRVELVYVASTKSVIQLKLNLNPGATVADAIHSSGIYDLHPETKDMPVGIYAELVAMDRVVKDGDRIEIYRPLTVDPKEKRRLRARVKRG